MIPAILAVLAYFAALLWVAPTLVNLQNQRDSDAKPNIKVVFGLGVLAVICHFLHLSNEMILNEGQNFTVANVVSLNSLLLSAIATAVLLSWRSIWFPLMVVYAFGICSVAVSGFVTGSVVKQLSSGLLFHLGIAIFAFVLFFLALLYAIQLNWIDSRLKQKKMYFCAVLPPLMTIERHLFTLTLAGEAMLTLALVSGMIYLHNFFAPEQVHKAVFSFLAWLVYAIQLLGQWKLHWRGKRVLIYSLSGMMLLVLGYFGSRF